MTPLRELVEALATKQLQPKITNAVSPCQTVLNLAVGNRLNSALNQIQIKNRKRNWLVPASTVRTKPAIPSSELEQFSLARQALSSPAGEQQDETSPDNNKRRCHANPQCSVNLHNWPKRGT